MNIKKTLFLLNELQYVKPLTVTLDIEGLGDRQFTTTSEIEAESLDEGSVEIYAYYKDVAKAKLLVDLETREVLHSDIVETDDYEIERESNEDWNEYHDTLKGMYNG